MNSKAQAAIRKLPEALCFDLHCRRFCSEVLCGGGTSGLRRKRIASVRKSRSRMARLWPFCRPCRSCVSRHAVAALRDARCRCQPGDRIAPRNWRSSVRPVTSPGALRYGAFATSEAFRRNANGSCPPVACFSSISALNSKTSLLTTRLASTTKRIRSYRDEGDRGSGGSELLRASDCALRSRDAAAKWSPRTRRVSPPCHQRRHPHEQ